MSLWTRLQKPTGKMLISLSGPNVVDDFGEVFQRMGDGEASIGFMMTVREARLIRPLVRKTEALGIDSKLLERSSINMGIRQLSVLLINTGAAPEAEYESMGKMLESLDGFSAILVCSSSLELVRDDFVNCAAEIEFFALGADNNNAEEVFLPSIEVPIAAARPERIPSRKRSMNEQTRHDDDDNEDDDVVFVCTVAPPRQKQDRKSVAIAGVLDGLNLRPRVTVPKVTRVSLAVREAELHKRSLATFIRSYEGSYAMRHARNHSTFPATSLVKTRKLEKYFRWWIGRKCNVAQYDFLMAKKTATIRRAGSSCCFLLAFMRLSEPTLKEASARSIFERLRNMDEQQLIRMECDFFSWYDKVPKARKNYVKMLGCDFNEERANSKEISTIRTVLMALNITLISFGILPISSRHNPDVLTTRVTNAIRTKISAKHVVLCGEVKDDKMSCGFKDLMHKFEQLAPNKHEGFDTPADLQGLLLAFTMAGVGVRPRTIQAAPKNVCAPDTVKKELIDDEEEDGEIELDYGGLAARQVSVYRAKRHENDPGCIRLEVEIDLTADKVTGHRVYNTRPIGFGWPVVCADGSLDWEAETAVILTLLSVAAGTVTEEGLFGENNEPTEEGGRVLISDPTKGNVPLLCASARGRTGDLQRHKQLVNVATAVSKLFDRLRLPSALFSAKSFRSGYAVDLAANYVSTIADKQPVTKDQIRQTIYNTNTWASRQADVYLKHVFGQITRHKHSSSGSTTSDWLRTIDSCSPFSRPSYEFETFADFRAKMTQEVEENLQELSQSDIRQLWRLHNAANYNKCPLRRSETTVVRERYGNSGRVLDLKATVSRLTRVMKVKTSAYSEALGNLYSDYPDRDEPFKCPLCDFDCDVAAVANEHWMKEHREGRDEEIDYCCPCTKRGGKHVIWPTLQAHVRSHHASSNNIPPFYFVYL